MIEAVRALGGQTLDLQRLSDGDYLRKALDPDHALFEAGGLLHFDSQASQRQWLSRLLPAIKYLPQLRRDQCVDELQQLASVHNSTGSGTNSVAQSRDESRDESLMLSHSQLRQLAAAGVEIGAHTLSHPILSRLSNEQASRDIERGREQLQQLLQQPVRYFAYPNGQPGQDYSPWHRDFIQAQGFEAALSTHWGVSGPDTDRWQLPRFTPWDKSPVRFLARLLWQRRREV